MSGGGAARTSKAGEDSLRNPDLVREMEARGSVVSKARLIRRASTSCVIDELLEEFVRLFSEVTTRLVRERHEVVARSGINNKSFSLKFQ